MSIVFRALSDDFLRDSFINILTEKIYLLFGQF